MLPQNKKSTFIDFTLIIILFWLAFNPTHLIFLILLSRTYGLNGFFSYLMFWYFYFWFCSFRKLRAPFGLEMRWILKKLFGHMCAKDQLFEIVYENKSEFDSLNKRAVVSANHNIIPFSFILTMIETNFTPLYHWSLRMFGIHSLFFKDAESCDSTTVKYMMKNNRDIGIIIGGFNDVALTRYGYYRSYILNNKGFTKYALQHGYNLFPMYTFNEEQFYYTFPFFQKQRIFLAKCCLPCCLAYSSLFPPYFGIHPMIGKGATVIIGNAIKLPHIINPTQSDIDKHHSLFVKSIRRIFKENVKKYGYSDKILELY